MTFSPHTRRRHIRLVLGAALAVSVAANVLAAEPSLVGRAVAAWPPVALMLVVDVLGRVPRSSGWLGRSVVAATAGVAFVAAVASYSHMRSVALAAGESNLVAYLFPLTVDGLAVVCSAGLVELNRRSITDATESDAVEAAPVVEVVPNTPDLVSSDGRDARPLVMLNNNHGKRAMR